MLVIEYELPYNLKKGDNDIFFMHETVAQQKLLEKNVERFEKLPPDEVERKLGEEFRPGSAIASAIREELAKRKETREKEAQVEANEKIEKSEPVVDEFRQYPDANSLRLALMSLVPPQYHNLIDHPQVLEVIWTNTVLTDHAANQKLSEKRKLALELVAKLAEITSRSVKDTGTKLAIRDIKNELLQRRAETGFIETTEVASVDLENGLFHAVAGANYKAAHYNCDKGQDAFAASKEGVLVVADGAGSYEKSGVVSGYLAKGLAERTAGARTFEEFRSIFTEQTLGSILTGIKESDAYKRFSNGKIARKNEGLTTFNVVRESSDGSSIEFASVGDSPIFVVDTDPAGNVIGFELVNDDLNGQAINQDNFYNRKTRDYLMDPETQAVGIRADGKIDLSSLSKLKSGSIPKKPGRKVIVASDSLTKILANCPRMYEVQAVTAEKQQVKDAFNNKAKHARESYPELWDDKGEMRWDFFAQDPEKQRQVLDRWRNDNFMYGDDVTIATINAHQANG